MFTQLETERLLLREMTPDDLPALEAIVCDAEAMYAWGHAWSKEEAAAGLQKQLDSYRQHGYGRWAVVLKETGDVIGLCGIQWVPSGDKDVPEIGYMFNRRFWHKGYAAEAALACKEYGFDALGFDELFSTVRDTNYASMKVAMRLGMTIRGWFVKHYRGVDMPHLIFSVRKGEDGDAPFGKDELAEAHKAILSLRNKSAKALTKLAEASWQHKKMTAMVQAADLALGLMDGGTDAPIPNHRLDAAHATLVDALNRAEAVIGKFSEGTAQHTLQKNRIAALVVALTLIERQRVA